MTGTLRFTWQGKPAVAVVTLDGWACEIPAVREMLDVLASPGDIRTSEGFPVNTALLRAREITGGEAELAEIPPSDPNIVY